MDNLEKIAIVPLALDPEYWSSEIHSAFATEYSSQGYDKISGEQDFDGAGDKVYLYPRRIPYKKGVPGKSEYQVLCKLAYEAQSRGYKLQAELVGD